MDDLLKQSGPFVGSSLLEFLYEPTDLNYTIYILHKLDEEQTQLIAENIPLHQWPRQLQDPEWDIKVVDALLGKDSDYGGINPGAKNFQIPESSKRIARIWKLRVPQDREKTKEWES